MTGRMLIELEKLFIEQKPDAVLVYGDTNSTLSAALASVKLHIPVVHVESGNRFNNLDSPEEVNRIVTDHVSSLRFACTESALNSLISENLSDDSYMFGDPMYDAFLFYRKKASNKEIAITTINDQRIALPERYYYMTCHRQENTGSDETLGQILDAMQSLPFPTIYPVHPRNREAVRRFMNTGRYSNILFSNPVGYLESIALESNCEKIVTDSGGVQREAFFAEKKCVTVLDFEVWPETMKDGRNELARPDKNDILLKLAKPQHVDESFRPFGDGHSMEKICSKTIDFLG